MAERKAQRMATPAPAKLDRYKAKRDFAVTAEPSGVAKASRARRKTPAPRAFVIQKHWASRLHYDFRLEHDGVLLSWAVPKGPSYDPADKQTAIHVEDHPTDYGSFEGTIPAKQYGAGTVIVWDNGTWEPVGDVAASMDKGKLLFHLHGQKLAGLWELVRISKPGEKQDRWILFKKRGDAWARPKAEYNVITELPDSVLEKPLGLVEEREPQTTTREKVAHTSADLSAARKAPLPASFKPQLATLASSPPPGSDWILENKFDGYRILAKISKGAVTLHTRGGHDWTAKMPALADEIARLGIESGWLDGEIVVLNDRGIPDFNALQNAMDKSRSGEVTYFAFDIPFLGGMDLRDVPLWSRRMVLQEIFERSGTPEHVRFSESFDAAPGQMVQAACQLGLEGIMVKKADSPYVSERTDTWLKLKCQQRQEFVVLGFNDRSGTSQEVGSMLLGYHKNGKLVYAGSVGTGWDTAKGRELHALLSKHLTDMPPVDPKTVKPGRWSRRRAGEDKWVRPVLVAEVGFSEWTPEGHVRHPVWKGMRADKPSKVITREKAVQPAGTASAARKVPHVKVSNANRVIDPSTGLTKLDLVQYYESVADWILPHLKDRPVSLVRAPTGITGELFFQKHPKESAMPGLTELDPSLWPGHAPLLAVHTAQELLAAAQMNVVEFHTWNSVTKKINQPDRIVFDLDPGEGVGWNDVKEAAVLTRAMLRALSLESWIKTSGGKGLHVVVPIAQKHDYDVVKDFSAAVVQHMARTIPQRFVSKSGPKNRVGKIFIDYLRNGHAQTTACAYSARSRPGLGVSVPIDWDDLEDVKSGAQWTISTAREHLSFVKSDPWVAYWKSRQQLTNAFKALGFKPKGK